MRTVLLASLRTHTRRFVSALVAVSIAVAFVVVIDALGAGARSGVAASVEAAYPEADLIVGEEYGIAEAGPDRVLRIAAHRGDRSAVIASTWTTVTGPDGVIGEDVRVGTVSTVPELRSQDVVMGRAPTRDDEALVATDTARSHGLGLGDRLTVGFDRQKSTVTIVGLTRSASYLDADVDLTWPALEALDAASPHAVAYDVRGGNVADALDALTAVTESTVQSRDDFVAAQIVMRNQGVDVLSYLLLLFAAVAGFVAVLVIANTFTILFAQRSRDFALLRCVGATRRQVVRSVRAEALALALVAGAAGILVGLVAGQALGWSLRALAGEQNFGTVTHSPAWLAAAFVGGVLATVIAAWWPTRAVVRVSPLAALRPAADPSVRSPVGRLRLGVGVLATLVGSGALAAAVHFESMPILLVGGMVSFVGVLVLGPVVVPVLLRLLGRIGRIGGPWRVAAANAVRNPRRSAATTASLLVGVTLATSILVGMASARDVVTSEMDADYPVDIALSSIAPFDPATVDAVRATDDVDTARAVTGARVESDAGPLTVIAPTEADRVVTHDRTSTEVGEEILIPATVAQGFEQGLPEELTLRTRHGEVTLATRVAGPQWGRAAIVPDSALARLAPAAAPHVVWILAEKGADAEELGGALGALTHGSAVEIDNNLEDQQWVTTQLDVLVWTVLGLLGVGVLIALVGIANTVGLSILERSREHALLRALGLTRRGLRRMLAAEGTLLAVVAALLGTALGIVYAWLGVETVVVPALGTGGLVVPWAQLAAVLAVAALSGLAASTLPARRGSRVSPAEGLTPD